MVTHTIISLIRVLEAVKFTFGTKLFKFSHKIMKVLTRLLPVCEKLLSKKGYVFF